MIEVCSEREREPKHDYKFGMYVVGALVFGIVQVDHAVLQYDFSLDTGKVGIRGG
jgi:hypothetical protein